MNGLVNGTEWAIDYSGVRLPKTKDGEKQGDFLKKTTSTLCDGLLIKRIPLFLKRWW